MLAKITQPMYLNFSRACKKNYYGVTNGNFAYSVQEYK